MYKNNYTEVDTHSVLRFFMDYKSSSTSSTESSFQKKLELFNSRKLAFDWIHAGNLQVKIGDTIRFIKKNKSILPLRSGHLGNWQEIFNGRSGALDHNNIVCTEKNIGYPYIMDFNQTENDTMNNGDTVYLPGSVISNRCRQKLSLFTWNGKNFENSSREFSYFAPFVLANIGGQLTSLTEIHRQSIAAFNNVKFYSALMVDNKEMISLIVKELLEYIIKNNCAVKLEDIINRAVSPNGIVMQCKLHFKNGGFYLHNTYYSSIESLVETIFIVCQSAYNPTFFINNVKSFPQNMPLLSLQFHYILCCILNTHYNPSILQQHKYIINNTMLNCHLHWGAYDSAGYPPCSKGYFRKKAKEIGKLHELIMHLFSNIKPIFFVLLPSAIFNLLPTSAYENDYKLIDQLFLSILRISDSDPKILMNSIKNKVKDWLDTNQKNISSYYLNRFAKRRCVFSGVLFEKSHALNLSSFEELSIQQACMILGAIHEALEFI